MRNFFSSIFSDNTSFENKLNHIRQLFQAGEFEKSLYEISEIQLKDHRKLIRLEALKSIIFSHMGEYEEGETLANSVFKRSKNLNDDYLICESIISLCHAYFEQGKINELLELIEKGKKNYLNKIGKKNKTDHKRFESTYYYFTAKVYRKQGYLDKSIEVFQKSIDLYDDKQDLFQLADSLNTLGTIYGAKKEFSKSFSYFEQSRELFSQLNNKKSLIKVLNNLGLVTWQGEGDLDKALNYFQNCLKIANTTGDKQQIGILSLNIGLINFNKGELNKVLKFYKNSETIFKELDNKLHLSTTLTNLAAFYETIGDLRQALDIYKESLEISIQLGNKQEEATILRNMGNTYKKMGEYETALHTYQDSLEIFTEVENLYIYVETIVDTIILLIELRRLEEAKSLQNQLKTIYENNEDKFINYLNLYSHAMILKEEDSIVDKVEALKLFREISKMETIKNIYKINVMLNLCELLLLELKITEDENAIEEIKLILDDLFELANNADIVPLLIEIYLFQSKLALVELNIELAETLLSKAYELSDEKNLISQNEKIKIEQIKLEDELIKLKDMFDSNASLYDRINYSRMADYIATAQQIVKEI